MESPRGSDDDSLDDSDLEEEPVQDISPGRTPSRGKPRDNSPSPGPQTSRTTPRTSATGYEVPEYAKPRVVVNTITSLLEYDLRASLDIKRILCRFENMMVDQISLAFTNHIRLSVWYIIYK